MIHEIAAAFIVGGFIITNTPETLDTQGKLENSLTTKIFGILIIIIASLFGMVP